jgi:hypothetical protein
VLAGFLGHDIRIHREFYQLPEDTTQVGALWCSLNLSIHLQVFKLKIICLVTIWPWHCWLKNT